MKYLNNKKAWLEAVKFSVAQSVVLLLAAYVLVSLVGFGSVSFPSLDIGNAIFITALIVLLALGTLIAQEILGLYAGKGFVMKALFALIASTPYAIFNGFSIGSVVFGAIGFMLSSYVYVKIVGMKI